MTDFSGVPESIHRKYIDEHGKPPHITSETVSGEVIPTPCECGSCLAWWRDHPEYDFSEGVPV